MKVLRRWRLARLAGCAALAFGLAGTAVAGSPPAQARVTSLTSNRQVAMFWGANRVTPFQETGLTEVIQVSAGGLHSLALRSDGTVWAWGANQAGQLGNGTTANSPVPVQVTGLSQVTGISAGFDASLATRTTGITALTSVWTWGGNASGQLGDGTFTSHLTPERVTGIKRPYRPFRVRSHASARGACAAGTSIRHHSFLVRGRVHAGTPGLGGAYRGCARSRGFSRGSVPSNHGGRCGRGRPGMQPPVMR
jgi:regulator of chromosome condensation (RCC1) repeat-containing protein